MFTYRSIGVVFLVIVMGPDGDLWQKFGYVGQVRHPLFVLHTVKRKGKRSKMPTFTGMTAELGGDGVCRNSQNPHVVITDIVLLWPRPFIKLQILNVFHHLQRAQCTWAECTETSSKRLLKSKDDPPSQYRGPGFHHRWAAQIQP